MATTADVDDGWACGYLELRKQKVREEEVAVDPTSL